MKAQRSSGGSSIIGYSGCAPAASTSPAPFPYPGRVHILLRLAGERAIDEIPSVRRGDRDASFAFARRGCFHSERGVKKVETNAVRKTRENRGGHVACCRLHSTILVAEAVVFYSLLAATRVFRISCSVDHSQRNAAVRVNISTCPRRVLNIPILI